MTAILISLLVSLLGSFLTELFKKWFGSKQGMRGGSMELLGALEQAKADFLSGVKWRFWLGPKRLQWASALYDRAQGRLTGSMVELSANAHELAAFCTDGLEKLTPDQLALKADPGPAAYKFKVLPNGLVKGGSASYSVDQFGVIKYVAAVTAGKWFLTKTYTYSGTYKVDVSILDPRTLQVGKVIEVGALQLRVASLGQGTAMVGLTVKGQQVTGSAILGTAGQRITLCSMDGSAVVSGFSVSISVRQEG